VYKNKIKISLTMPYFFKYKELKKVFLLLIPRLFSTGILHLNIIISRLLGSLIGEGAVSALYYANRLIHLPLALFGISVSTAIMPGIISSYERKDTKAMKLQIYQAIKLILLVNLPSMIILILFGKFIIKILFEHGKFSLVQTNLTYQALAFYSIGLIAYSTTRVLTAVYHAMQNTKIPLYISIISLIINFLLCIILMNYLGVGGIALASSIAAITNSLLLGFILIKKNFNLR
jgi:putative peptidoglycan lipid II flippase